MAAQNFIGSSPQGNGLSKTPAKLSGKVLIGLLGHVTIPEPITGAREWSTLVTSPGSVPTPGDWDMRPCAF